MTTEFVTESYFSGGLANYIHRVSQALKGRGHEVHILVTTMDEDADFELDGVYVHRVSLPRFGRPMPIFDRLTLAAFASIRYIVATIKAVHRGLARVHAQSPLDLVQFPNLVGCGLLAIRRLNIPHVIRISGFSPYWYRAAAAIMFHPAIITERITEARQIRDSRHVFAPSLLLKGIIEKEFAGKNVPVIRTPFFNEVPTPDDSVRRERLGEKRYLLFVGRLQRHKGVMTLASAIPHVLAACTDMHFVLVGADCPYRMNWSMRGRLVNRYWTEFRDRITFIDALPHAQLYPIIEKARLVVLPSIIDNFPNTALECMALGKAVVGTRGASFDEFITDGENGFLVPIGDAPALARKLTEVWNRTDLEQIGENARRKIEEFSPENTVPDLERYYESVIRDERHV